MYSPISSEYRLKIFLFGGCTFQCEGAIVRLATMKTSALMAYLAMHPGPQPRLKLINLFWGNQPEASARRNLRQALWNIRQQFQCSDQPPILLNNSDEIVFNQTSLDWIDIQAFELCLKSEAELTAAALPDNRYALLRQAIDLYRGDLLDCIYVDDSPEFEQWLLVERERLRAQAVNILQRLVRFYADWGDHATGVEYARRLLEMEPWLEEAHHQMMRLLALGGQRSAALAQYEICRRVLAEELNAEPGREIQTLYESIYVGTESNRSVQQAAPRRKLPPQATPFVGRQKELAQLASLLDNPTCRLITLVGPGGIGKTRLAVRLAAENDQFWDGIYFVPLAGITSSDLFASAIADTLGVALHGGENIRSQVVEALQPKCILLLLDNFEHLLPATDFLVEILQVAPKVKVLVTSRERLNLQDEWLFPIDGLLYPAKDATDWLSVPPDSYTAIQLFVQGAQRVRLGFVLGEADRPFVAQVCQMVDGMPLAIELAANWARLLSCQEIADRMEQSIDFLATGWRDLAPRHRSMRIVFEQSWQLLTDDEREVFKRLTVFRGGFRLEAAQAVANATIGQLASLVDKSFLKRNPVGRYEMHELLRQFGAEKLNETETLQTRQAHGIYFARFLESCKDDLSNRRVKATIEAVAEDIENVRAGWEWAVLGRHVLELGQAHFSLHYFYELRSWFQEGEAAFEQAAAALNTLAPDPEQQIVLGRLYNIQGFFCNRLSHYTKSVTALETSLAIARRVDPRNAMHPLANLAATQFLHGAFSEAIQLLEESMTLYRQNEHWQYFYAAQGSLGYVLCQIGDYSQARALLNESLVSLLKIGMPDDIAFVYHHLGLVELGVKDNGKATLYLEKGLEIFHELGHAWGIAACLSTLACVMLQKGEFDQAERMAREGIFHAKQAGSAHIEAICLNCLGHKGSMENKDTVAFSFYQQAIRIAWETAQWPPLLDGIIGIAELEMKRSHWQIVAELLACAIRHPSTVARERQRAMLLLAQLNALLEPDKLESAQQRGETEKFDVIVEKLLADKDTRCAAE